MIGGTGMPLVCGRNR